MEGCLRARTGLCGLCLNELFLLNSMSSVAEFDVQKTYFPFAVDTTKHLIRLHHRAMTRLFRANTHELHLPSVQSQKKNITSHLIPSTSMLDT
jgi:hypothetical protein